MKKTIILIILIIPTTFFSFVEEKKIRFEFTIEETQLIYDALGELPAKRVEVLRNRIMVEAQKQLNDTTSKK